MIPINSSKLPNYPNRNSQFPQKMSPTSTVCQGLQSCLEPLLLEPRVLMHQLVPSKHALSFPWPHKLTENSKNSPIDEINTNGEESSLNCWNFMKSVTKSIDESENVYVHPLSKRSSSSLSTKSLEMCTESLGSETGSDVDLSFDESNTEKQSCDGIKETKTRKVRQRSSFPPPLTSISGSEGVHVQTHREGGRLVIKAFCFPASGGLFQAERRDGRLRLSLMKDVESENEGDENGEEEGEYENVDNAPDDCDEESDGEEGEIKGCFREGKIGCKLGGEWCSSSSRCNGDRSSRKRLQSLQCCVAIS